MQTNFLKYLTLDLQFANGGYILYRDITHIFINDIESYLKRVSLFHFVVRLFSSNIEFIHRDLEASSRSDKNLYGNECFCFKFACSS